jgi:hypothetical protein
MNASDQIMRAVEAAADADAANRGPGAPRGGQAVLNPFLKETATVPLFFAQTMIASLRKRRLQQYDIGGLRAR